MQIEDVKSSVRLYFKHIIETILFGESPMLMQIFLYASFESNKMSNFRTFNFTLIIIIDRLNETVQRV